MHKFCFLSLKDKVKAREEEKNDNKAKMKGGLGWIIGLRACSPYNGDHFSSYSGSFDILPNFASQNPSPNNYVGNNEKGLVTMGR